MGYENILQKHLRLTLLRSLKDDPGYTMNESMLTDISEHYGFNPSRDNVRTELSWLKEQGLVTIDDGSGIMVATLTQRGEDVARGRATVPGVQRPSPRKVK